MSATPKFQLEYETRLFTVNAKGPQREPLFGLPPKRAKPVHYYPSILNVQQNQVYR
nr:MAG TPA: hypothetical protein [Caudoviricetes sp.]